MKFFAAVCALLVASASAFAPLPTKVQHVGASAAAAATPTRIMASSSDEYYIDMERRVAMNWIVVGSSALTVGAFGIPFIAFFFPPGSGGGAAGVSAKDALGNDIVAKEYLALKPAGDRSLAQGLKGDAT